MAKPNYSYAKRQKDLARKKKQEEKRLRKASKKSPQQEVNTGQSPGEGETGGAP